MAKNIPDLSGRKTTQKDAIKLSPPKVTSAKKKRKSLSPESSTVNTPKLSQRKKDQSKNKKKAAFTKSELDIFRKEKRRAQAKIRYWRNKHAVDLSDALNPDTTTLKNIKNRKQLSDARQIIEKFISKKIDKNDYYYTVEGYDGQKRSFTRESLEKMNSQRGFQVMASQERFARIKDEMYQHYGVTVEDNIESVAEISKKYPDSELGKMYEQAFNSGFGGEYNWIDIKSLKSQQSINEYVKRWDNPGAKLAKMNNQVQENVINAVKNTYGDYVSAEELDELISAMESLNNNDFMDLFYTNDDVHPWYIYQGDSTHLQNKGLFKDRAGKKDYFENKLDTNFSKLQSLFLNK